MHIEREAGGEPHTIIRRVEILNQSSMTMLHAVLMDLTYTLTPQVHFRGVGAARKARISIFHNRVLR